MEIVRTKTYGRGVKRLKKLGAKQSDIDAMEQLLALSPDAGDVIQGTGGLRKARFAYRAAGKSGGGRTIYYAMANDGALYLLAAYAKVDKEDLTADEKRLFKALLKDLTDGE